jgi:hypothetical protein
MRTPPRGRRKIHARPRPDRNLARHACAAPRADQHACAAREQIRLQVALIPPLMHIKGPAASETKAAAEQARLLIQQAEALGEAPEDPLLLFSVLNPFLALKVVAFNGDVRGRYRDHCQWDFLT